MRSERKPRGSWGEGGKGGRDCILTKGEGGGGGEGGGEVRVRDCYDKKKQGNITNRMAKFQLREVRVVGIPI